MNINATDWCQYIADIQIRIINESNFDIGKKPLDLNEATKWELIKTVVDNLQIAKMWLQGKCRG